MTLSNATVPQFTVERAVDWTAVRRQRAKLPTELSAGETRPSVNDFLLQAIARALIRFPELNATFWGCANLPDAGVVPAKGAHIGLVSLLRMACSFPFFHGVEHSASLTGPGGGGTFLNAH